ncbi:MAG: putative DsbA family dithiol-disulfide isomerase [Sulfurimonas sp.]|jgi:predicted DsbA family dithiol-disulfide isomerase
MKKIIRRILMIAMISQMLSINALASDKIKIDIVSDVVCPWCAIGYQKLSNAIKELDATDKVEIVWHPFQLNPDMPREGKNANKYLMDKLGLNEEQLIEKRKSVAKIGEESGFKFDYFKKMRKVNTFNAHILLDYAKDFHKQTELKVRLQQAYFAEHKDISNREILYAELKAVGLNADEAMKTLDDKKVIQRVEDEEKYWRARGVYAIPTMVFDEEHTLVGANEVSTYKELLQELINKRKENKVLK